MWVLVSACLVVSAAGLALVVSASGLRMAAANCVFLRLDWLEHQGERIETYKGQTRISMPSLFQLNHQLHTGILLARIEKMRWSVYLENL